MSKNMDKLIAGKEILPTGTYPVYLGLEQIQMRNKD